MVSRVSQMAYIRDTHTHTTVLRIDRPTFSQWNAPVVTFGPCFAWLLLLLKFNYLAHSLNAALRRRRPRRRRRHRPRPCFEYFRLNLFGITANGKQLRNFYEYAIKYFCAYYVFAIAIAYKRMSESMQMRAFIWVDAFFNHRQSGCRTFCAFYGFALSTFSTKPFVFIFHLFSPSLSLSRLSSLNGISMRLLRALKLFAAIWSDFHTISHRKLRPALVDLRQNSGWRWTKNKLKLYRRNGEIKKRHAHSAVWVDGCQIIERLVETTMELSLSLSWPDIDPSKRLQYYLYQARRLAKKCVWMPTEHEPFAVVLYQPTAKAYANESAENLDILCRSGYTNG